MEESTKVYGVEDVKNIFKECTKVSQKAITQSVKKGGNVVLDDAKSKIYTGGFNEKTGITKKSLKLKLEKARKKGKRVYTVGTTGQGWRGVFINYGFTDKNGKFHQGNKFLTNARDKNRAKVNQIIIDSLVAELEKIKGNQIKK